MIKHIYEAVKSVSEIDDYIDSIHMREKHDWDLTEFKYFELKEIPVNKINDFEYMYDAYWVEKLVTDPRFVENLDPLVVYPFEEKINGKLYEYDLIDGMHRLMALKELGIKKVKTWVGVRK